VFNSKRVLDGRLDEALYFALAGEAADLVLREDDLAVPDDVELPFAARSRDRVHSSR